MRRPEPLDPAVERELAALDAALAGTPDPDVDAELAALVRDVRAVAPRLDAPARARLDARVAECPQPAPRRRLSLPSLRILAPAFGAVAVALLAVVLVGRSGDSPSGSSNGGSDAAAPAIEQSRDSGGGGSSPSSSSAGSATPAAPSLATPAPAPGRRVERTVTLALGTTADGFDRVTDGVVRTTQRAGGFVAQSSTLQNGSRGTATFVLRIPAARLDAAVADLSRLAHVRSIEQAATDLTGATDGTAARLRDARTQRRAIVAALATATGTREDRLRARLNVVTARVRALERSLRALRARTAYATVDLTVSAPRRQAAAPGGDDHWTPADAWRDARRALEVAAGVAIVALALGLPLALLAAALVLAAGALRRRRREAALDLL